MAVPLSAYWRLVRSNRNFRRLWFAQIVSEMGDWIYTVAIYSLLLELTGSAKSVALAIVVQVLPQSFVAPIAGVINDRASRKRVMIAADLARAVIVLGMLVVGRAQIVPLMYALLALEAMMWALFEPGRTAILPNITGSQDLVTANTLSSMTWSLNMALGAGLGGAVAAFLGRDSVFVLDSVSFLLSAALLRGMVVREPHLAGSKPFRARDLVDFSPIAEGVRYVARDKRIFALLLVKAGMGLLATHWVLLPIFGQRVFPVKAVGSQRGAMLGMSALMSASGLGALPGIRAGLPAASRGALARNRLPRRGAGPRRHVPGLGLLDHPAPVPDRRPLPRPRFLGRLRLPGAHHVAHHLHLRPDGRLGCFRTATGSRYRPAGAPAGWRLGVRNAAVHSRPSRGMTPTIPSFPSGVLKISPSLWPAARAASSSVYSGIRSVSMSTSRVTNSMMLYVNGALGFSSVTGSSVRDNRNA